MLLDIKKLLAILTLGLFAGVECNVTICYQPSETTNYDLNAQLLMEPQRVTSLLVDLKNEILNELRSHLGPFGEIALDIHHAAIRLNGTVDQLVIDNIDDFNIGIMCNAKDRLELFNMTFNDMQLDGLYDIDGNIGDLFDIYGKGKFHIEMTKFSVAFPIEREVTPNGTCWSYTLLLNMVKMDSTMEHFMTEELNDMFNRAVGAIAPEAMEIIWDEIKENALPEISKPINNIIKKHTEVLKLLNLYTEYDDLFPKKKQCIISI